MNNWTPNAHYASHRCSPMPLLVLCALLSRMQASVVTVVDFLVVQVKFNRFLHLNEHPEMILCYLIRLFDAESSKIGHHFTKKIFLKVVFS